MSLSFKLVSIPRESGPPPRRRRGPARFVVAAVAAVVVMPVGIGMAALLTATTGNPTSKFSITSLYSPTALTVARTDAVVTLNWTPPAQFNGNGYAVRGVDNGASKVCPAAAAAYTTFVTGLAAGSVTYADNASPLLDATGPYVCYLVQTAYSPGGPPPWAGVPLWTSVNALTTAAVQMQIAKVQVGPESAVGAPPAVPTLNAASTAGSLLIATLAADAGCATFSSPGAGWARAVRALEPSSALTEIWYLKSAPAGITTVSFPCPGAGLAGGTLSEWSGVNTVAPLDKAASKIDSSGGSATITVTTAANTTLKYDLAITAFVDSTGAPTTFVSGPGWSRAITDTNQGSIFDYRLMLPIALASEQVTASRAGRWTATLASFKR